MKIAVNVPVLIPTYNPTERIIEVVRSLISAGFERLIIVDDGSRPECSPIFAALAEMPQCTLLHHDVNRGKGRGLKTGFAYILEHMPECCGVVTTDDDGQHSPEDILRCAEKMEQSGRAVLGARDFTGDDVPPRSRFGNNCTRFVFRALCGIRITDTQTGLRALPISYLPALAKLSGERFEYETNMLLEMKRLGLPFDEVRIQTIYNDKNSGSHFHPLRDSIKIYVVIFRFMLSSGICSLIDIGLFTLINLLFQQHGAADTHRHSGRPGGILPGEFPCEQERGVPFREEHQARRREVLHACGVPAHRVVPLRERDCDDFRRRSQRMADRYKNNRGYSAVLRQLRNTARLGLCRLKGAYA